MGQPISNPFPQDFQGRRVDEISFQGGGSGQFRGTRERARKLRTHPAAAPRNKHQKTSSSSARDTRPQAPPTTAPARMHIKRTSLGCRRAITGSPSRKDHRRIVIMYISDALKSAKDSSGRECYALDLLVTRAKLPSNTMAIVAGSGVGFG